MSKKVKANLYVGEAYVVATLDRWEHVISTYRTLAEDFTSQEDKDLFLELADQFQEWVDYTAYRVEDDDNDW